MMWVKWYFVRVVILCLVRFWKVVLLFSWCVMLLLLCFFRLSMVKFIVVVLRIFMKVCRVCWLCMLKVLLLI